MNSLWLDIRYSCRSLSKSPVLSCTIILTLALAIGVNTSVFTILNEIFLKSVPFEDADRIVMIRQEPFFAITTETSRDFLDALKEGPFFEEVTAFSGAGVSLSINGVAPTRVIALRTTSSFFKVLKVQPKLGRFFRANEDWRSKPIPLILTYSCWQKRFEGDYQVIGRTVRIDGESATIIGVAPKSVEELFGGELWMTSPSPASRVPVGLFFLLQNSNLVQHFYPLKALQRLW